MILAGDINPRTELKEDFLSLKRASPLYVTHRRGGKLDAIYASEGIQVSECKVEGSVEDHDSVSDHFALTAKIKGTMIMKQRTEYRITKKYAAKISKDNLKSAKTALEFLKLMKENVSTKKLYTKGKCKLDKVPEWKTAMAQAFITIKNRDALDRHISEGYKSFCRGLEKNYDANFHKFFKKKARGGQGQGAGVITCIQDENGELLSSEESAKRIAQNFKEIHSQTDPEETLKRVDFPDLGPVETKHMIAMMSMIAQNKAISFDGVHESIFHVLKNGKDKDTADRAELLKDIFKPEVLNSSYMEHALTGRLIPLNKVFPNTPTIDQYRPIVALSPMAKILEARIAVKLKRYVKRFCTHSQTGFVQGCGTFINLHRIMKWCNLNKTPRGILLFIDLRKAYDSVPLGTLFKMMRTNKALSDDELQYLQACYTRMRVGVLTNKGPTFFKCTKGVLQGSMISPLLFNIFFDSLLSRLHSEGLRITQQFAYADDLALGLNDKVQLDKAIDCIEKWSTDMKIQINKAKSGIVQLGAQERSKREFKPNEQNPDYRGYPKLDSYKYLGIHLDYKVNLEPHRKQLVEKTDRLTKKYIQILV